MGYLRILFCPYTEDICGRVEPELNVSRYVSSHSDLLEDSHEVVSSNHSMNEQPPRMIPKRIAVSGMHRPRLESQLICRFDC